MMIKRVIFYSVILSLVLVFTTVYLPQSSEKASASHVGAVSGQGWDPCRRESGQSIIAEAGHLTDKILIPEYLQKKNNRNASGSTPQVVPATYSYNGKNIEAKWFFNSRNSIVSNSVTGINSYMGNTGNHYPGANQNSNLYYDRLEIKNHLGQFVKIVVRDPYTGVTKNLGSTASYPAILGVAFGKEQLDIMATYFPSAIPPYAVNGLMKPSHADPYLANFPPMDWGKVWVNTISESRGVFKPIFVNGKLLTEGDPAYKLDEEPKNYDFDKDGLVSLTEIINKVKQDTDVYLGI